MITPSVTSSSISPGSMPVSSTQAAQALDEVGARELVRGDVDRDHERAAPATARTARARSASRSTHSPIGTMSPDSSATRDELPGRHQAAPPGACQRRSASKPVTERSRRSKSGW